MKYRKIKIMVLFAIIFFLMSSTSQSAVVDLPPEASLPERSGAFIDHIHFICPNETSPYEAHKILRHAPSGVYISVGTERGFMGVLLTPRANSLLLIDHDPMVIWYNEINIALLQVAKNRNDYLQLRLEARYEEWVHRASKSSFMDPRHKEILLDQRAWQFWEKEVRRPARFNTFHTPPQIAPSTFFGANYLFNDSLFNRISEMAKKGHIQALFFDLEDPHSIERITQALKGGKLEISVLDISNTWDGYCTHKKADYTTMSMEDQIQYNARIMAQRLEIFKKVSQPESILLMTTWGESIPWIYFGYTFDRFVSLEKTKELFSSLLRDKKDYSRPIQRLSGMLNGTLCKDPVSVISKNYTHSLLKAYGSSFGLYFLGREGAHLILSALDGKFAEVDTMIESLFDWREHAEFAGFAGVMTGAEMTADLAMVRMLGPEKLPILRSIVKHSMGMIVAMELTALSREYLENPQGLSMILDRHLSKENLARLIGVTASFLVSRPLIQYGIGGVQALRHGTKVTAWSPQGFLAKAGLEVMVFTAVGLAERYLLPTADRMMLSSSLEDQIESLQEKTKNNALSEKDLLALEEIYQYIIQYHMNDFIRERQEFMDGFKEDVEAAAQKDPKSIQMRDHAVQRMQKNPSYFTDFDTILEDRDLEREPIKQDEQIRLKTQEMIRIASTSADRWEAYRKDKAQGKIENWLEEMGQEEGEVNLYAFPQTIAHTFWHQKELLDSLLAQAPDERRIILQDAQKRLEARKLMFGRTLEELNPQ